MRTKKCKACGVNPIEAGIGALKFCPACMDASRQAKENLAREAGALGLVMSPHGQPKIPDGYMPIGYVPDSGHIGFRIVSVEPGRYLYRVNTWDCPDGLDQVEEATGVILRPAKKVEAAEPSGPIGYDAYGNPIYGDGGELL